MWGVLELVPLRGEKNSSHAHKTGSWYLFGVLFKISNKHPVLSTWESSPPPPFPLGWGKGGDSLVKESEKNLEGEQKQSGPMFHLETVQLQPGYQKHPQS